MPNVRWLLALITSVHRWLFVRSGGRLGGGVLGFRFLLLEHVGRKSGRTYRTPLLYVPDGASLVVVASNAGDARDPAWLGNLRAHPDVRVRLGREVRDVRAREATPAERERLWPILDAAYSYYPAYRARAAREIPIVLLAPRRAVHFGDGPTS